MSLVLLLLPFVSYFTPPVPKVERDDAPGEDRFVPGEEKAVILRTSESTGLLRPGRLTPGRLSILFKGTQCCHRPVVMVLRVPNGSVLFQ